MAHPIKWTFALILLAACSGGNDGRGTQQPLTFDTVCESVADALAARASACVGGPSEAWRLILDGPGTANFCGQLLRGVAANRITVDESQLPACEQAIATAPCGALLNGSLPAACEATFAGGVAENGECFAEPECAGDAACVTSIACPGVCVPRVAENGACTETGPECTLGTTCVAGRCARPSPIDGPCGEGQPECAFGLTCFASPGAPTGTCQGAQQSGACTDDSQCAPKFMCALLAPAVSECVEGKPLGSECIPGANECQVLTGCIDNRCQVFPALGEVCDPTGRTDACLQGFCDSVTGTCVAPKAANEPCQFDAECDSGACVNGACTASCAAL